MTTSLDDMSLFVAVAQAHSFSKAAEQLNLPKSTLSVAVNRLEKHLGLKLLNRTTRRLELTDTGAFYLQKAAQIVSEADLLHQQIAQRLAQPQGLLRISLPVEFAQHFLAPILPSFCEQYPKIQLKLELNAKRVDLLSEPFDLAIRMGELPDSSLIAKKITQIAGGLYASQTYLAQFGTPDSIDDLSEHHCLGFASGMTDTWRLIHQNGSEQTIAIQANISSNNFGMNMKLAQAGLGIVALPKLVSLDNQRASLEQILPEWHTPAVPVYAVTASRLMPEKVKVFLNFIMDYLNVDVDD